jgi:hypothetical protein
MKKINKKLFARQGDVGFISSVIPETAKSIKARPLALGEVTGHSHQVSLADLPGVEMYEVEDETGKRTFMRVTAEGEVSVVHEEHGTVTLPSGWEGEVVIAREYDEEEDFRRVID